MLKGKQDLPLCKPFQNGQYYCYMSLYTGSPKCRISYTFHLLLRSVFFHGVNIFLLRPNALNKPPVLDDCVLVSGKYLSKPWLASVSLILSAHWFPCPYQSTWLCKVVTSCQKSAATQLQTATGFFCVWTIFSILYSKWPLVVLSQR